MSNYNSNSLSNHSPPSSDFLSSFDQNDWLKVCPICNEPVNDLAELNEHLDDVHSDSESAIDVKDGLVKWLKNAQSTILKPLSKTKLNNIQTLRQFTLKLDQEGVGTSVIFDQNPEGPIVKNHWQPHGDNDTCSISNCKKSLNILSGKNNCRKLVKDFFSEILI